MSLLRSSALARIARTSTTKQVRANTRALSTTTPRLAADHAHEDHYDPPGGWLWGVKPGEKREKEGWETLWIVGFFGSLAVTAVAYAFKPDTS